MPYKVRKTLGPPSRPDLQGPCVIEDEDGKLIATMEGFGCEEQYKLACKIVGDGTLLEEMARALEAVLNITRVTDGYDIVMDGERVLQEYREM